VCQVRCGVSSRISILSFTCQRAGLDRPSPGPIPPNGRAAEDRRASQALDRLDQARPGFGRRTEAAGVIRWDSEGIAVDLLDSLEGRLKILVPPFDGSLNRL
jgi:hypothetical protein